MDVYLIAFALGVAGLLVMALGGLGRHGGGHAGHGHVGHGPAARGGAARGGAGRGTGGHGQAAHQAAHGAAGAAGAAAARDLVVALASPRVFLAVLLGSGAAGLLLRPILHGGVLLAVAALAGGVLLERGAVAPVWRWAERFASNPAQTLDMALYDHAQAASGFDARGEGLVALEVDGQIVQLLGRLRPEDQSRRVRAGDRLRIEAVDAERHRCTVSVAGPA